MIMIITNINTRTTVFIRLHPARPSRPSLRWSHLSNATCLTHVFFKIGKYAANSISRIRQVMP